MKTRERKREVVLNCEIGIRSLDDVHFGKALIRACCLLEEDTAFSSQQYRRNVNEVSITDSRDGTKDFVEVG